MIPFLAFFLTTFLRSTHETLHEYNLLLLLHSSTTSYLSSALWCPQSPGMTALTFQKKTKE